MELLAVAVFITGLLCSNAESPPSLAPADCNDAQIEKDAGVALDLINKHRRGGYILSLLRVADAYTQHLENASVVYLTLDVVDTECLVLSGKHWSSCGDRPFYRNTEFGQCKAVVYTNQFSKQEKLYGYNCTMSPVPPQLYECKDCPVRIAILEDAENYNEEAKKLLQKYNQESNQTRYFKLEKVQKIFSAIGSRTAYVIEFTIKETSCLQTTVPTNVSECEFLHSRDARVGFCRGKLIKDTKDPNEVELNFCEIYDIPYDRHPFHHHHHHHFHNDSGEYPHCNMSKHECRPPGASHRNHSPHHHHHHHHSPHHPHHHHHDFGHRQWHRYRHGHRCPPPSHHDHHGHTGRKDHHNSSEPSKEIPGLRPPPGPQLPPPPAGGPHHLPPSKYPSPPLGPPPPPPQPPCPPDSLCEHRLQPPHWFHKHGHRHHRDHKCNDTSGEQGGASSEEHDSFRHHHPFHHDTSDSIYYIPVLSQHDVLQAPSANFLNHPHSPHRSPKKPHVHGKHVHEKPVIQPFPDILSESKSCPGYPKLNPVAGLLLLYPPRSTQ